MSAELVLLIKFAELVLPSLIELGDDYLSIQSIAKRLSNGEVIPISEVEAAFNTLESANNNLQNLD